MLAHRRALRVHVTGAQLSIAPNSRRLISSGMNTQIVVCSYNGILRSSGNESLYLRATHGMTFISIVWAEIS